MGTEFCKTLGLACVVVSIIALGAGACGMVLSFLYMASARLEDVTAGAAGFVAGSVLVGAGLISLTILTVKASSTRDGAAAQS